MINVVAKSGNLAPYLKATQQVVASGIKPLAPAIPKQGKKVVVATGVSPITSYGLSKGLPMGPMSVVSGPGGLFYYFKLHKFFMRLKKKLLCNFYLRLSYVANLNVKK